MSHTSSVLRTLAAAAAITAASSAAVSSAAHAADFDWKKFKGRTITFLANNNPISQALLTHKADFETLTGMTLKVRRVPGTADASAARHRDERA